MFTDIKSFEMNRIVTTTTTATTATATTATATATATITAASLCPPLYTPRQQIVLLVVAVVFMSVFDLAHTQFNAPITYLELQRENTKDLSDKRNDSAQSLEKC